jgi:hypothetical protein
MRTRLLLMSSALIIVVSVAIPKDFGWIPVGSLILNPNSFTGRSIKVCGLLAVLREDVSLWDSSFQSKFDAWITYEEGWEKRSPKSAVNELDKMRRKSDFSFPHQGSNAMQLNFVTSDAVLEGILKANSDRPDDNANFGNIGTATAGRCSHYVFSIHRILSLSDRKAPTAK